MKAKIISKPNQNLKYVDPNFETEGVDEDDYQYIYCEDFFSTGYADDAGASYMFDYDYEKGIVKFEYDGTEEELIQIAKDGGDGGVEFIDDFLKRIRLFEEEFNIEWEICEYIGDDGFDWA